MCLVILLHNIQLKLCTAKFFALEMYDHRPELSKERLVVGEEF